MVSGVSTDYTNRLQDLHISGGLNFLSSSVQPVTYKFGTVTKYIAGPQKLIQRFVISLINSGLVEELIGSTASNIQTARNVFNLHKGDIVKLYRDYQNNLDADTIPLDEQLDTVQLISVTSSLDTIKFSVKLITKAGDTVTLLLPLPLM